MKYTLIIATLILALSGCSIGSEEANAPSPYPTIPLSSSGDTTTTPPLPANNTAASFKATGTEPFWSADITPTSTTLSRPGETGTDTKTFETSQTDKGALITIKDAKGEFFVNLLKGECSDGMSETKYSYNATVLVGADTLKGCANVVK